MEPKVNENGIDLEGRLQRSRGRAGRVFVASAKVTRKELDEVEAAAESAGKAVSEWAREALLREARSSSKDALFTETVAIRVLLNNVLRAVALGQKMTAETFEEVQAKVRLEKHNAARAIMQQYAGAKPEDR